ncbi:metallophosphoesterase [uncultured Methanoregula sp.]|uniref:metallophosphoesterase n=1 Tax=uncultured Methanoregula sp. TaxID=1005933 RepID=UPI002AAB9B78|nr:metallophosphoesterase [uncultured Methanoregula sp.]
MKIEFLRDGPALVIERDLRLLIVADMHFGIEADLAMHGLYFRSRSAGRLERLQRTIDQADPDELILLGDVKHSIPTLTRQEYDEMPKILEALRGRIPIRVFPGNHDIGIERFLEDRELMPKEGAILDGVGYLHGHMYPAPALGGHLIVVGHHHPLLSIRDEVGCALQAPAYIRAGLDTKKLGLKPAPGTGAVSRALFVPAFNEISGYDILQIVKNPFSPISRCMVHEETEIILADGTYIGSLKSIQINEDA